MQHGFRSAALCKLFVGSNSSALVVTNLYLRANKQVLITPEFCSAVPVYIDPILSYRPHPKDGEGNVFSLLAHPLGGGGGRGTPVSGPRSFLGGGWYPSLRSFLGGTPD